MTNPAVDMQTTDPSIDALAKVILQEFDPQKVNRALGRTKYYGYWKNPVRFGKAVLRERYAPQVEELMNSVRDYEITVAVSANSVGKTHAAAAIAVWFFQVYARSQVYLAAAPPETNLRLLLWRQIMDRVQRHPDLFQNMDITTSMRIVRDNNSFIAGLTIPSSGTPEQREAKFSGKHAQHILFILDEGDAIPDEVYRGVESCMSGGHARLLVLFNPRRRAGAAYNLIRNGQANVVQLRAFDHPNVITGRDVIPGAVTRPKTVRRINEWTRPLAEGEEPDGSCFELPYFLEGAVGTDSKGRPYPPLERGWRKILVPQFSYMVLGEYPPEGENQLISADWIERAQDRWKLYVSEHGEKKESRPIIGFDVASMGADSNCLCYRAGNFVWDLVTWGGVDSYGSAEHAYPLLHKHGKPERVRVDSTGVGDGVSTHLAKLARKDKQEKSLSRVPVDRVMVGGSPTGRADIGRFGALRDELWWMCREWLRKEDAMLPDDDTLKEELTAATYEVVNGKIKVSSKEQMKKILGRSPDRADALCLTFVPEAGKRKAPRIRILDLGGE